MRLLEVKIEIYKIDSVDMNISQLPVSLSYQKIAPAFSRYITSM